MTLVNGHNHHVAAVVHHLHQVTSTGIVEEELTMAKGHRHQAVAHHLHQV
jgi:hypothetical protein